MRAERVVILGAAGRDFHDFNVLYRGRPEFRVVAFTAAQIPNIAGRRYPAVLAGPGYPDGIPIVPEAELAALIRREEVGTAVLAYSDLPYAEVMHKAAIVQAAGASFVLPGASQTWLTSTRPVVSICAVRTGAGKSPLTRFTARHLRSRGRRVAIVRHPMPYGDLAAQAVQRFATFEDLDRADCTIEEREEYEPHLREGAVVFAGVDYEAILRRAELEADVVLWDGGNNDLPFYRPDLHVVVADPHRPGHEVGYYPGEANLRLAQVVVISKTDSARPEDVATVEANARRVNPGAQLFRSGLRISATAESVLAGRRCLVVEDGPTVTHGGMAYGAGTLLARARGAIIVDPRPFAVGSIAGVYAQFPHLTHVLPAMGYGPEQVAELQETIRRSDADIVVDGSPVDLRRLVDVPMPIVNVRYEFSEPSGEYLRLLDGFLDSHAGAPQVPSRPTAAGATSSR